VSGSVYAQAGQDSLPPVGQQVDLTAAVTGPGQVRPTPTGAGTSQVQGLTLDLTTPPGQADTVANSVYGSVHSSSDSLSLLSRLSGIVLSAGGPAAAGQAALVGPVVDLQAGGEAQVLYGR
jgi:hypothetical protein